MKRATLLLLVLFLFAGSIQGAFARPPAASINCTDRTFILQISKDIDVLNFYLNDLTNNASDIDRFRVAAAVGLVGSIDLRHKYEAMPKMSDGCETIKAVIVPLVLGTSDFFGYTLSAIDVPNRRDELIKVATAQGAQLTRLTGDVIVVLKQASSDTVADTAPTFTATPTTVLDTPAPTFTAIPPTRSVATKAPVAPVATKVPAAATSLPAPTSAPAAQANGATALCKDGTLYTGANHRGACSHHGGVSVFYK